MAWVTDPPEGAVQLVETMGELARSETLVGVERPAGQQRAGAGLESIGLEPLAPLQLVAEPLQVERQRLRRA